MIHRLRHLIFDRTGLKLLSLLIAVLMWYAVAHEPVEEISVHVPIEFAQPPKNLDYAAETVPQAQLRLRGPARLMRDLQQEDVRVVVDLRNAGVGEHTYDLTPRQVKVPHDVDVMQITPNRLRLVFDTAETRQVTVKPRIVGNLPPGYKIASTVASPATLTISGPARHVSAIDSALTDAVDVTGLSGQATFDTRAYLPDPLVQLSDSSAVRVTVTTEKISSKAGAR